MILPFFFSSPPWTPSSSLLGPSSDGIHIECIIPNEMNNSCMEIQYLVHFWPCFFMIWFACLSFCGFCCLSFVGKVVLSTVTQRHLPPDYDLSFDFMLFVSRFIIYCLDCRWTRVRKPLIVLICYCCYNTLMYWDNIFAYCVQVTRLTLMKCTVTYVLLVAS